jgi:peptidoglycan hydrolase CwlO-like protein
MLKKIILSIAGMLVATSFCLAQTVQAQDNTHKTYDQRARDCKKLAAEKKLTGNERRAFLAACMKL